MKAGAVPHSAAGAPRSARRAATPAKLYAARLRQLEEALPHLAGLAQRQACDWDGIEVRFELDEPGERLRICAVAGRPPPATELARLQDVLARQLRTITPSYWLPGWDEQLGLVVVSHLFLTGDMHEPVIALGTQIDMCVRMARLLKSDAPLGASAEGKARGAEAAPVTRPPRASPWSAAAKG